MNYDKVLFHARIPNLTTRTKAALILADLEISQSLLMMFHN